MPPKRLIERGTRKGALELHKKVRGYFKLPGVLKRSAHHHVDEDGPFYVDFDELVGNPARSEEIMALYIDRIECIENNRRIDFLGYIEKSSDVMTGPIVLAGGISVQTYRPFIIVRSEFESEFDKVKVWINKEKNTKTGLYGMQGCVLTDHVTTGRVVLKAADAIEYHGGKVTDVLAYSHNSDLFKKDKFTQREIDFYSLYQIPLDLWLEKMDLSSLEQ